MIRKILKVILYIVLAFLTLALGLVTIWWINSTPPQCHPPGDTEYSVLLLKFGV